MSVTLSIAGTDRYADLWKNTLKAKSVLTNQMDTAEFNLRGTRPNEGSEVIITDSVQGVKFKGILDKVTTKKSEPERVWACKCMDYTYRLDQLLVVETYEGWTADAIVIDLLTKYAPGFTHTHVQSGAPTVEKISFSYVRLSECFKRLAKYVNWSWYVDSDKDVWFFAEGKFDTPAPVSITDSTFVRDFKVDFDRGGLANRVYIIGGLMLSDPQGIEWKADGVARTWALPWPLYEPTMDINGTPKTIGLENVDDPTTVDFIHNRDEKYIRCALASTPAQGVTISIQAKQQIPVITILDDTDSQAAVRAMEGGTGIYEEVITDDTLVTIAAAEAAGQAYLNEHADPVTSGSFIITTPGWSVGQLLPINRTLDGLNNTYIVDAIEQTYYEKAWEWDIRFGGRLIGIPDILKALVSSQQEQRKEESTILQKYVYDPETVTLSDALITTPRSLPFICGDADAICGLVEVSNG